MLAMYEPEVELEWLYRQWQGHVYHDQSQEVVKLQKCNKKLHKSKIKFNFTAVITKL